MVKKLKLSASSYAHNGMTTVSIIIIGYKNKQALQTCLASIPKNSSYEIIVIDNTIENRGFAKGCNLGAARAQGKYLFFLNPDTVLNPDTLERLLAGLQADDSVGIIAPSFVDDNHLPYRNYSVQPTRINTPFLFSSLKKIIPVSLLHRLDPYTSDSLTEKKYVEAVSGAALCIEKKLFMSIGGFDEEYFMYWEDYDICQKVLDVGKNILFFPAAQLIHSNGGMTRDKKTSQQVFVAARAKFLKKRFGLFYALIVENFIRLTEKSLHFIIP